jgi:hypothetical protein
MTLLVGSHTATMGPASAAAAHACMCFIERLVQPTQSALQAVTACAGPCVAIACLAAPPPCSLPNLSPPTFGMSFPWLATS